MTSTNLAATESTVPVDEARVEEFATELLSHYTSGMLSLMVDLGHRTGLFAAAAEGPTTSEELAARAGLHERYVRRVARRARHRRHRSCTTRPRRRTPFPPSMPPC